MAKLMILSIGDNGTPVGVKIVRQTELPKHLQKLLHREERNQNLFLATRETHIRISSLIKKMDYVNGWKAHVNELVFLRDQVLPEIANNDSKLTGAWNASHLEGIKNQISEIEAMVSRAESKFRWKRADPDTLELPLVGKKTLIGTSSSTLVQEADPYEIAARLKQDSLQICWGASFPLKEMALLNDRSKRVRVEGIMKD